jgi:hypothetical protein
MLSSAPGTRSLRGQAERMLSKKARPIGRASYLCAPPAADQSSGSTLMIAAPWLLPTQKVGGVVALSTNTRLMLV